MTDRLFQSSVPDRIISERMTAEILGISSDTLRRLNRRGEGPVRRKISPRRVGYKVSEVEAYRDNPDAMAKPSDTAPATRPQRLPQALARNRDRSRDA